MSAFLRVCNYYYNYSMQWKEFASFKLNRPVKVCTHIIFKSGLPSVIPGTLTRSDLDYLLTKEQVGPAVKSALLANSIQCLNSNSNKNILLF